MTLETLITQLRQTHVQYWVHHPFLDYFWLFGFFYSPNPTQPSCFTQFVFLCLLAKKCLKVANKDWMAMGDVWLTNKQRRLFHGVRAIWTTNMNCQNIYFISDSNAQQCRRHTILFYQLLLQDNQEGNKN